jgi:hypothetical protein
MVVRGTDGMRSELDETGGTESPARDEKSGRLDRLYHPNAVDHAIVQDRHDHVVPVVVLHHQHYFVRGARTRDSLPVVGAAPEEQQCRHENPSGNPLSEWPPP